MGSAFLCAVTPVRFWGALELPQWEWDELKFIGFGRKKNLRSISCREEGGSAFLCAVALIRFWGALELPQWEWDEQC
ncbi:hypothetical protein DV515_00017492 [Chloebia gouldiae]|uniref:Uncharacterized protein n=1 Tax=Chloebia gouldiae TaxID=44316 RepID=A0A3L8QAN4_CHLGU|nr:hypothetical protein DV515_00017492 [Chloebia gouldiae]